MGAGSRINRHSFLFRRAGMSSCQPDSPGCLHCRLIRTEDLPSSLDPSILSHCRHWYPGNMKARGDGDHEGAERDRLYVTGHSCIEWIRWSASTSIKTDTPLNDVKDVTCLHSQAYFIQRSAIVEANVSPLLSRPQHYGWRELNSSGSMHKLLHTQRETERTG